LSSLLIIYDKTDYTRSCAGAHVRDGRPVSPVAARIPRGYAVEEQGHRGLGIIAAEPPAK